MVWLLINWLANVAETLRDILKHYFLQVNSAKYVKCMLEKITCNGNQNQGLV